MHFIPLSKSLGNSQNKKTTFFMVNFKTRNRQLEIDLHIKPTNTHHLDTHASVREVKPIVRFSDITGFALRMNYLINPATTSRND